MVHCNPAPPHPPPGEIYNALCLGQPYVEGYPVGYAIVGALLLFGLATVLLLHLSESKSQRLEADSGR